MSTPAGFGLLRCPRCWAADPEGVEVTRTDPAPDARGRFVRAALCHRCGTAFREVTWGGYTRTEVTGPVGLTVPDTEGQPAVVFDGGPVGEAVMLVTQTVGLGDDPVTVEGD